MLRQLTTAVFLTTVLLVSCSSPLTTPAATTSPATALIVATAQATPPAMSTVRTPPTAIPEPTDSASVVPSLPSETPGPTPIPSNTVPPATANARATTLAFLSGRSRYWDSLSPNGQWVAYGDLEQTVVIHLSDGREWRLSYFQSFGQRVGDLHGALFANHWSQDGRYLYLSAFPEIDGPLFFIDGAMLLRLDLDSGAMVDVLPIGSDLDLYAFAFAPTDARLAYIRLGHPPLTVNLLHMTNGMRVQFALSAAYTQAGSMVWTEEGDRLALAATVGEVSYDENNQFAVAVLDIDGSVVEVVPAGNRWLDPIAWMDDNTLLLWERSGNDGYWSLDVRSGVMVEAAPP